MGGNISALSFSSFFCLELNRDRTYNINIQ